MVLPKPKLCTSKRLLLIAINQKYIMLLCNNTFEFCANNIKISMKERIFHL